MEWILLDGYRELMNVSENQIFESFLPVYDAIPEKWDDARPFVVEMLKRISNAVNIREIGWFLDEELLTGKAFIPADNAGGGSTNQAFRQVFRMVVDFGSLPNSSAKMVPHNIPDIGNNFTLTFMGAYASDPSGLTYLPIPYADPNTLANAIELDMDDTNVIITTGTNRSNFTRTFVVIEYMQEL